MSKVRMLVAVALVVGFGWVSAQQGSDSSAAALRAERAERYDGQTGDNGRRHHNGSFIITPTAEGAKAPRLLRSARRHQPTANDGFLRILRRRVYEDTRGLAYSAPDASRRWPGPLRN